MDWRIAWDATRAGSVPLTLQAITPQDIAAQLASMPAEWHTANTQAMPAWWAPTHLASYANNSRPYSMAEEAA